MQQSTTTTSSTTTITSITTNSIITNSFTSPRMKCLLVLVPLLGCAAAQGGGLFSGLTGAFNNFFGGSVSPQFPCSQ